MSRGGRVAEVYAQLADLSWRCGSGYHLGRGLVLTAGHVVVGNAAGRVRVRVRLLGDADLVDASVVWRPADGADVALVQVDGGGRVSPVHGGGPRWGRLVGDRPGVSCTGVGFPDVQARPDRVRDSEQFDGAINPLTAAKAGLLAVSVSDPPARINAAASPWAGMSGAAVFCGELLTAVIVQDPAGWASHRLRAVAVARFATDAGFVDLVTAATGVPVVWTPVELAALFVRPAPADSPAALLRADRATVRFRGRRGDLDRLVGWCLDDRWSTVRLLAGPGGQGKTRLADELVRAMAGRGWVAGRIVEDAPSRVVEAVAATVYPVLLVVDYAEARAGQIEAVMRCLADAQVATRLLLVARSAGEWLSDLAARSPTTSGLATVAVDHLGPVDTIPGDRITAWREAVTDLAAALTTVPDDTPAAWPDIAAHPDTRPPSGRALDRLDTVLALHTHALATLLQTGRGVPLAGRRAEDVLLLHEQRYWTRTAASAGLTLTTATARRAVVAATVWSATDPTEAVAVVRGVPGLADLTHDRQHAAVSWLAGLYPGQGRLWGGLQPDRLGEYLTATVLATPPDTGLLDTTAAQATLGQVEHALTVLTRAEVDHHHLHAVITRLIVNHPIAARAAISVATETDNPGPLTAALTAVTRIEAPDQLALLHTLHSCLPARSQVLLDVAAQIGAALTRLYRRQAVDDPDTGLPNLARSLNDLSNRLAGLGRREDALAAAAEAVTLHRQLARTSDAFVADLARSLHNHAIRLADVGRHQEALTVVEESIATRQRLGPDGPDTVAPDRALSLTNLCDRLDALGHHEQALTAIDEAVAIRRRLTGDHPDGTAHKLGYALESLAIQLSALGHHEKALAAIDEAVDIYRHLAHTRPDAYLPDLALSLNNLSNRLGALGRHHDALTAVEESVRLHRQLAEPRPDAFLPDVALSLNNLSNRLSALGRHHDALTAVDESVHLHRHLAQTHPDVFLPGLATALNNLAVQLHALNRQQEALHTNTEAIAIYLHLIRTRPDPFTTELTNAANNRIAIMRHNSDRVRFSLSDLRDLGQAARSYSCW